MLSISEGDVSSALYLIGMSRALDSPLAEMVYKYNVFPYLSPVADLATWEGDREYPMQERPGSQLLWKGREESKAAKGRGPKTVLTNALWNCPERGKMVRTLYPPYVIARCGQPWERHGCVSRKLLKERETAEGQHVLH